MRENEMQTQTLEYAAGDTLCQGHLIFNSTLQEKRPGILVAHAWQGQDNFAREKAQRLAELRYVALATDLYGNGKYVENKEEAAQLMKPLFMDRNLLRERIIAAYQTLKMQPQVDSSQIGAIGFCFGGLTVLELLRSGTPVKGVVSFHGVLGNSLGEMKAQTAPTAGNISGSILLLHGYEDPLVSQQDIDSLQKELNQAGANWQMNIYGHTKHAFTNPKAHDDSMGLVFNPLVSKRAWQSMCLFFEEVFNR
jgi:dienelactone hydrolase